MMKRVTLLAALALAAGCPKPSAVADAGTADAGVKKAGANDTNTRGAPGGSGGGMGAGGGAGGGGTGGGQGRMSAPIVYQDGEPVAFMAFGDLPPGLKTRFELIGGATVPARRFALFEYLEALRIPRFTEVHLYSGRERVSIYKYDELVKEKEKAVFAFTQGTAGKVQMRWPDEPTVATRIDKVSAVAVYVDKKPPVHYPDKVGLWLDGEKLSEVPYVSKDVKGGTRVYLDGRLAFFLRPRDLGDQSFSIADLAKKHGIQGLKAADLVWQDQDTRMTAQELSSLQFVCPPGSGGIIETRDGTRSAIAVQLYKDAVPPDWSKR